MYRAEASHSAEAGHAHFRSLGCSLVFQSEGLVWKWKMVLSIVPMTYTAVKLPGERSTVWPVCHA